MKKKIYILTVALIATAACICASTPYLTVNYVTGEGPCSDYFHGRKEIQIWNDVVILFLQAILVKTGLTTLIRFVPCNLLMLFQQSMK